MQITALLPFLALAQSVIASPIAEHTIALNPRAGCPAKVNSFCKQFREVLGQCRNGQWNCVHGNPLTLDGNYPIYTPAGVSCSKEGDTCL
ncbi:hypothetical protein CGLO_15832 [Colletotrichum gloeosporioides Cg-14]|uniref:Uncharacterized protein n=1 Tax=Colletotrichum gloeosporioides (strain Cg-14) TaxID=1237896 RepID=T0JQ19_COLGC|nr:hypothetical protein CGLO_15832 [Colletotrichum gloeosporioides Cg-14]